MPGLLEDGITYQFDSGFKLPLNFIMILPAPRDSGKSYFIQHFLELPLVDYYDIVIIICPSLNVNHDYDAFLPKENFQFVANPTKRYLKQLFTNAYTCKSEVVENERQRYKAIASGIMHKEDAACRFPTMRMPKTLVIMDDCLDSGILDFGGIIDTYAARGRHSDLAVIVSAQRLRSISLTLRINSDFIILFEPYSVLEMEKFLAEFVSFSSRKVMRTKIRSIFSVAYNFIVVNNKLKGAPTKLFVSNTDMFMKGQMVPILFPEEE